MIRAILIAGVLLISSLMMAQGRMETSRFWSGYVQPGAEFFVPVPIEGYDNFGLYIDARDTAKFTMYFYCGLNGSETFIVQYTDSVVLYGNSGEWKAKMIELRSCSTSRIPWGCSVLGIGITGYQYPADATDYGEVNFYIVGHKIQ